MIEQIALARRYARIVWPFRWAGLLCAMVICVPGWIYVYYMPNTYEASAKIFVDTRSMLRPLLKGLAVNTDSLASSAALMKRTLLTRPNLEAVARRTDMDLTAKNEKQFENLITGLATRVSVAGTSRDNIYEIKFVDKEPGRAKQVVDELLNTFLENALGNNRSDTAVTKKFLDEQIAEYEKRLIEAEDRLKEFKQRNVGKMPGEGGGYYTRLEAQRAELKQARLELTEAVRRRDELNKQLGGNSAKTGDTVPGAPTETEYSDRIASLETNLDQLLLQYTEKHPDVIATRATLERLQGKHEEELARLIKEFKEQPLLSDSGSHSAAYNEIRLALAQTEAAAAALQSRVTEYEQRVAELEELVDTIPEVEAELLRLDRDYALNSQQYNELLERREAARLGQEVDQTADDIKLKVIEPPRVPLKPTGPDRPKFVSLVLVGALGVGVALSFLLSQLNPRFHTPDELKEFARLPILGAISLASNRRQQSERRMEMAVFGAVLAGLVFVYIGLLSIDSTEFDLHAKLVQLVDRQS